MILLRFEFIINSQKIAYQTLVFRLNEYKLTGLDLWGIPTALLSYTSNSYPKTQFKFYSSNA